MLEQFKPIAKLVDLILVIFSVVVAYLYFGDGNPLEAIFWMLSAMFWGRGQGK